MIERLLRLQGVDYRQWKALVGASLRMDLRRGRATVGGRKPPRAWAHVARLLIGYVVTGGFVAALISGSETTFAPAVMFLSTLAFMIATVVLLEFHSVVVSPDDYQILAYQPIESQTFFWARLTDVLLYTWALGTAFSLGPLYVFTFALDGFRPDLGLGALAAAYGVTTASTLVILTMYAMILRVIPPRRVRAVLSYFQLALAFAIYSGFFVFRTQRSLAVLPSFDLASTPWLLLYPVSWFAGIVEIAGGTAGALEWLLCLPALAAVVLLLGYASRTLSLQYSERISALEAAQQEADTQGSAPGGWLFRRGEGRVIGLLVRRQFRHDYRFRLGVLGVIPLTLLYVLMGLSEGPLPDPFDAEPLTAGTALLYLAVLIAPALLVPSFVFSDAFPASWLYHVTPVSPQRLVLGMRNYILACFVVPYVALVGLLFAYFYHTVWHALVHAVVLGLASGLFLLLSMLVNKGLPFAAPVQRGRFSLRMLIPYFLAPAIGFTVLPLLFSTAYQSLAGIAYLIAALVLANFVLGRLLSRRIGRLSGEVQYLG